MAWYCDEDNDGLYELYIGQNDGVLADHNSSYAFYGFTDASYFSLIGSSY